MILYFPALLLLCTTMALSQTPDSMRANSAAASAVGLDSRIGLGAVSNTDKRISALQSQVKEAPGDYKGYDHLGTAYLQKARETGDVAYFELAEKALDQSLALASKDFSSVDPLVDLAAVYMGEHRFSEALALSQRAIAIGAGNLQAFAIAGDAYTDMGEYEKAAAAYNGLRSLGTAVSSPLIISFMADSRTSYLRFIEGDTAESIRLLKQSIVAARQLNLAQENLAWLYYELGERYSQAGDLQHAEMAYSAALAADASHYRSLAGMARVRAAQGRFDESIRLYKASIAVVPFPQYIAELGDVYLQTGDQAAAQQQYDLVEYIGYLGKLNRVLSNRELALFYADREIKLPQALQLARNELDVRHDIYTWDTLAWVLYKNHQLTEAAQAMTKALALHTEDAMLLFHAGTIEHGLGDDTAAERNLHQAAKINPHFHLFYAEQANRTLAEIERARQARSSQ